MHWPHLRHQLSAAQQTSTQIFSHRASNCPVASNSDTERISDRARLSTTGGAAKLLLSRERTTTAEVNFILTVAFWKGGWEIYGYMLRFWGAYVSNIIHGVALLCSSHLLEIGGFCLKSVLVYYRKWVCWLMFWRKKRRKLSFIRSIYITSTDEVLDPVNLWVAYWSPTQLVAEGLAFRQGAEGAERSPALYRSCQSGLSLSLGNCNLTAIQRRQKSPWRDILEIPDTPQRA